MFLPTLPARFPAPASILAIVLVLVGLAPASAVQDAVQDAVQAEARAPEEEARTHYLGRRIARTMHWRGAEWLLRETRENEEHTRRMLAELGIEPGNTVCDLGCGNGYHTLKMARMVGDEGRVIGVDIQLEMLSMLADRAREADLANVTGILGTPSDPRLEPSSCDLIVLADVYHEIDHPESVLFHARAALRPGGRLVLVEFRLEDPDVPIKPLHKMSKAQILNELALNGFRFAREVDVLPQQHLMLFEARPVPADETPEDALARQAEEVARGLVRALGAADAAVLEAFWADEVELLAGSELTKEKWGGTGAAERVPRSGLRRRYEVLFESAGTELWKGRFGTETADLSIRPAGDHPGDHPGDDPSDHPRTLPGDSIVELRVGGAAQEPYLWVLRRTPEGLWQVVAERADY